MTIEAHGGKLVNAVVTGEEAKELAREAAHLTPVRLDARQTSDVEMISVGAFSPLEGFVGRDDYHSILHNMRLADGLPWSIPVTLAVGEEQARSIEEGKDIALYAETGEALAIFGVEEIYVRDKTEEALSVFGTDDTAHPGVAYLLSDGDFLIGGKLKRVREIGTPQFHRYRLTPKQTRQAFKERNWRTVVGFQTRNPVHRAHEYIQKCALESVDGLLLHPLVGETKSDDIPADVRMECYEALLENYYPNDRVLLSVMPAAMRYAGPKEAIFHAIIRKNYGCTHFIVGRDHAGVGSYYGSFDAHYIFGEYQAGELGITPLFFDYTFYCRRCGQMASYKTCPHTSEDHITLSGTKVREMIGRGEELQAEFTRPEVAEVMKNWILKCKTYEI